MAASDCDEKVQPGDMVEIFRGSYQHWALYVGHGAVVHLAPPSECAGAGPGSKMSIFADRALVKREELWEVVGKDRYRVNNHLDHKYKPRLSDDVVREALALVGQMLSYCIISANCEHFVTNLRYGKPESRQVRQAGEAILLTGVTMSAVGLAVAALLGLISSKDKDGHKH
uniref:phospholipase A and acyltransferase 3-like n=1 Tax=Doryrhamphus excisus TaxID=161450 RepID=UPI0025AE4C04|nr:phospholipase A and acyltransferase 3-like [Doryrhamphus excisus]XP_057919022.1 phospholipase A and acyltransferase 3-like [Doryrhamphus excisus]XP_057919023.1 phospholipase A and acyltransferase 3-like [Doryrhamphus excisus]XP_057919024.1 phospholipase A and acyltransferase 3-like [Doryrhamphus excisus]